MTQKKVKLIMSNREKLMGIYSLLLEHYGEQGWWPVSIDKTITYSREFKHRPKTEKEIWEIALGAVLTQNTSWDNVLKVITLLNEKDLLSIESILYHPTEELALLIRSSRYHNQKAPRIQRLAAFFMDQGMERLKNLSSDQLREVLLSLKGIGEETADDILLYAFDIPYFVADAYTRRLFSRLEFFPPNSKYKEVQSFLHEHLARDPVFFNEFHALIVEFCIKLCKSKPLCSACFLKPNCPFSQHIKEKPTREKV